VIAATNRDLPAFVKARAFREDLFFRLAAALVPIPALRQRLEDLPLLIPVLLADLGAANLSVADETYVRLAAHSWPGNVRELKNTLASALAFAEGGTLEPSHLHFMPTVADARPLEQLMLGGKSLESLERVAIAQTLAQHAGNKSQTALALGISLSTLYEKLKKFGL